MTTKMDDSTTSEKAKELFVLRISTILTVIYALIGIFIAIICDSLTLFVDALHSVVDVIVSVLAIFVVRKIQEPPNPHYNYGYAKYEPFMIAVDGLLIMAICAGSIVGSVQDIVHPEPVKHLQVIIIYSFISIFICIGFGLYMKSIGDKISSELLKADSQLWIIEGIVSAGVFEVGPATVAQTADQLLHGQAGAERAHLRVTLGEVARGVLEHRAEVVVRPEHEGTRPLEQGFHRPQQRRHRVDMGEVVTGVDDEVRVEVGQRAHPLDLLGLPRREVQVRDLEDTHRCAARREGRHGIPPQREPGAFDERRVGEAGDPGTDEAADGAKGGAGEVGHLSILAKAGGRDRIGDDRDAVGRRRCDVADTGGRLCP